eukprot:40439_1
MDNGNIKNPNILFQNISVNNINPFPTNILQKKRIRYFHGQLRNRYDIRFYGGRGKELKEVVQYFMILPMIILKGHVFIWYKIVFFISVRIDKSSNDTTLDTSTFIDNYFGDQAADLYIKNTKDRSPPIIVIMDNTQRSPSVHSSTPISDTNLS